MTEIPYAKCTLTCGEDRIKALVPSCFATKGNVVVVSHKFYRIDSVSPTISSKTIDDTLVIKDVDNSNVPVYPVMSKIQTRVNNDFS
jgi:hypothetical protein